MRSDRLDELVSQAAAGDRSALDALLRRIEPKTMAICTRVLPNYHDAQEACQDALGQVADNIATFDGRSQFTTWLHAVAGNSARMTYRRLCQRSRENVVPDAAAEKPDPRTTSVIAGTRLDLLEALDRLDREQPQLGSPWLLRDLFGQSYAEIAEHLDLPLGTVKARIHQARHEMRILLGR